MNPSLEDELRAALRAAAANVDDSGSEQSLSESHLSVGRRRTGHRWAGAATAAAAVVAVVLSTVFLRTGEQVDREPTSGAVLHEQSASVDGIELPIPAGAHLDTLNDTSLSISVCVHQTRSSTCADGVTVTVARPDSTGRYTELPNPALVGNCQWITQRGPQQLAGRAAQVVTIGCGISSTGPTALAWYLSDGTLSVTTPPGIAGPLADDVASGLILSNWPNTGEQQLIVQSS